MSSDHTATFIGHSDCAGVDVSALRQEIVKLIENGVSEFLNGGMGGFDWLCARTVNGLKKTYPHIKNNLVIPYLTAKILKEEEAINRQMFDCIVYPEGFERYHFKAAITARNKYLVDNSAYAICYIVTDTRKSRALETYKRAVRKGLTVINLGGYKYEIRV